LLSLFRRNLNYNLVALAVFTTALHLGYLFKYQPGTIDWPLIQEQGGTSIWNLKFPRIILAIALISLQAILVNRLVVKHKLSIVLSTIPGALFIIYSVTILEPEILHPILVANTLLVLSIGSLFKIYKKHLPVASIFNAGCYLAIASLFYAPYLCYSVVLLLGLFSLRTLELKEVLQLLTGLVAPFFLIGVFFFYCGKLNLLGEHFLGNLALPWTEFDFDPKTWIKPVTVMLATGVLVLMNNVNKKKRKFDAIKKIELCYWMLLVSVLSLFLVNGISIQHLLIVSVPIGILGGLLMETKPNSLIKEFIFLLLVAAFLAFQFDVI